MRRRDVASTAFRNIRRQKMRSILTIFAIVIGATSVSIMLALVSGARNYFLNQFESSGQLQQVQVSAQTDLTYSPGGGGGPAGPGSSNTKTLTDALATQIQHFAHVVALARQAGVNAFDYMQYNGGTQLDMRNGGGGQAYDPNGVIQHQFLAGGEFTATDNYDATTNTGPIIISSDYADKMGFSGNYAGLIGKQITLATQPQFSGEGATLPDPTAQFKACQNGGCPNGGPNGGPGMQSHTPTILLARVVGITSAGNGGTGATLFPLKWAIGLALMRQYQQVQSNTPPPPCSPPPGPNTGPINQGNGFNGCPQPTPTFVLQTSNQITGESSGIAAGTPSDPQQHSGYNSFIVKVDDPANADSVATQIKTLGVGAVSAQTFITQQLNNFALLSLILGGIGGIALLVAAIGVVNTMVMAILERTREIGVLRACGATKRTIRRLFTTEAATLGFLGGCLGIGLAWILTLVANRIINQQLNLKSVKAQDIIGMPIWLIVAVIGATTVIGMLAGLFPAIRAARLNPIDALRYE